MTGPEHYEEAELQAECAAREIDDGERELAHLSLGLAQVHATLALAAAYGLANSGEMPLRACDEWSKITTTRRGAS